MSLPPIVKGHSQPLQLQNGTLSALSKAAQKRFKRACGQNKSFVVLRVQECHLGEFLYPLSFLHFFFKAIKIKWEVNIVSMRHLLERKQKFSYVNLDHLMNMVSFTWWSSSDLFTRILMALGPVPRFRFSKIGCHFKKYFFKSIVFKGGEMREDHFWTSSKESFFLKQLFSLRVLLFFLKEKNSKVTNNFCILFSAQLSRVHLSSKEGNVIGAPCLGLHVSKKTALSLSWWWWWWSIHPHSRVAFRTQSFYLATKHAHAIIFFEAFFFCKWMLSSKNYRQSPPTKGEEDEDQR